MRLRFGLIGGLALLLLGQAAKAETPPEPCPEDGLQTTAQALVLAQLGAVTALENAQAFSNYAARCTDQPYLLAVSAQALTLAAGEAEDINTKATLLTRAWTILNQYAALPEPTEPLELWVKDTSGTPQRMVITTRQIRSTRETLVPSLLNLAAAGAAHPDFTPDATFQRCDSLVYWELSKVNAWMREADTPEFAYDYLLKRAEPCRAGASQIERSSLAQVANAKVFMAPRIEDPVERLELLQSAMVDIADLKGERETSAYWYASRQDALDKALAAAEEAARPRLLMLRYAEWFEADQIGTPAAIETIASSLNEVWAVPEGETTEASFPKRMQAFGQRVGYLATYAVERGVREEGYAMLLAAVTAFNDGTYRNEATRDLPNPPDYLYSWLDLAAAED